MTIFIGALFLIICLLLIVVVLLQKGRGGGLGAAFGGMGSSAFGTRTGDVFTWVTIVLTGLFLLLAIGASLLFRPTPDKVLRPQFLPKPGPIKERTAVTITCMTPGAVIRYTIDGTEPTEKSMPYEQSFRINPGTTVKARAFRTKWEASELAVGAYPAVMGATQPGTRPGAGRATTAPSGGSMTTAPAGA